LFFLWILRDATLCLLTGRGVDINRNWSVDWGKKEKVCAFLHLHAFLSLCFLLHGTLYVPYLSRSWVYMGISPTLYNMLIPIQFSSQSTSNTMMSVMNWESSICCFGLRSVVNSYLMIQVVNISTPGLLIHVILESKRAWIATFVVVFVAVRFWIVSYLDEFQRQSFGYLSELFVGGYGCRIMIHLKNILDLLHLVSQRHR